MKLTIESTNKIVTLKPGLFSDGVQARVWEGTSETGIKVICLISRVAISAGEEEKADQFKAELKQCKAPSPEVQELPLRLILD